jgi:thioesterase domain-containing protein
MRPAQRRTQTIDIDEIGAILEPQTYVLATSNLNDLHRELAQLERMLTPLLNQVRRMQGKTPVVAQGDKP